MTGQLVVHQAGPSVSVQDLGRPGNLAFGLSPGGAADRLAHIEGAVLLGQGLDCASLEMAGFGGEFELTADGCIALTGAPMMAKLDGQPLVWNASHSVLAGQRLSIGSVTAGMYGYLHIAGGIDAPAFLGSRAAHLASGIGALLRAGDELPLGAADGSGRAGMKITVADRFSGGVVRVLPSVQTALFPAETLARFEATDFAPTSRRNRQGVQMHFDGAPFAAGAQLTILSENMIAGDIQMTGVGEPFVLLPECQTTGGYPRIATVIPDDLPKVAQASPATPIRFVFVTHEAALKAHRPPERYRLDVRATLQPLIRDPRNIPDLLGYQLISGAITGWE